MVSKLKIVYQSGATSIDLDEVQDLIPDYISTMAELNQVEQSNIADAYVWVGKQTHEEILTASFVFKLHEKMFGQVWKWAGKIRRSNKNIGVMKEHIMNDLAQLFGDTQYWIDHRTFHNDEIAARFHHRLVQIHVFPNGNGRHARLMADLLLAKYGDPPFTWGLKEAPRQLEIEDRSRRAYINALKEADRDEFSSLIQFARS